MKQTVVLGMSGGVDSSVAAFLLKESGYQVIGVTMQLISGNEGCSDDVKANFLSSLRDARKIASQLDIPHYVMNLESEFDKRIISYFVNEYAQGHTPNPCIACNKYIKFGSFRLGAKKFQADYIATGHYARVEFSESWNRFVLKRAVDRKKDQTYFLYNLNQETLSQLLLPLGGYTKEQVRDLARKYKLSTSSKRDSEEICFVSNKDHGSFIAKRNPELIRTGHFVDAEGHRLGKHRGVVYYTIGQRKGLGIALGKRMFVSHIDPLTGDITLTDEEVLYKHKLIIENYNFIPFSLLPQPMEVWVKIRHSMNESKGLISLKGEQLLVEFEKPVRAPSMGQSAVFYQGDLVIGGGVITRTYDK